mgnify:CR=1 FL=1
MKPLNLKMSAFGPYKNEVEIDFKKLGTNNIFLITGDTGAGKTTIFDAISYALFNEVSGSNRPITSLRSKFATTEDTYVELEFEHKEKEYKIRRVPEYERVKKTGEGTTKNIADAYLEYEDKIITGVKNVNDKIIELIGINAKQFKQISMLAQGEFIKILFAESKDRTEIFRKIFETSIYEQISTNLSILSAETRKDVDRLKTIFQTNTSNIRWIEKPVAIDLIDLKKITKLDIDEILNLIEKEIQINKDQIKEEEKENEKLKKEIEKLREKIKKIEEQNEKVKKYKKYLEENEELKQKAKEIKEKETKIKVSQSVLQKVMPKQQIVNEKQKELKINIDKKQVLEKEIKNGEIIEQENKNKILKLNELKEILDKYKTIKEKSKNIEDMFLLITQIEKDQKIKEKYVKQYEKLNNQYIEIDEQYKEEEDKFFREQAGIIAQRLEEGKPCPVCGSIEHPNKAIKNDDVLSEEELKKLEEEKNKLENKRNTIKNETISLNAKIETTIKMIPESNKQDFNLQDFEKQINESKNKQELEIKSLKENFENVCLIFAKKKENIDKINFDEIKQNIEKQINGQNNKLLENKVKLKECNTLIETQEKSLEVIQQEYLNAIKELGFKDEKDYKEKTLKEADIEKIKQEIEQYKEKVTTTKTRLEDVKKELKEKEIIDVTQDIEQLEQSSQKQKEEEKQINNKKASISFNKDTNKKLKETAIELIDKMDKMAKIEELAKIANGTANRKTKITFEQYVQATYFDMVISEANKRLLSMTDNRYLLIRKKKADKISEKIGLDLNVIDNYNGQERDVKSLSGGESFKAALSLALGLSDVIQSYSGGVLVDTLFIDEGFGTLDAESREQAINTLVNLAGSNKLIGIISHVEELQERIDKKIIVEKGQDGSNIK